MMPRSKHSEADSGSMERSRNLEISMGIPSSCCGGEMPCWQNIDRNTTKTGKKVPSASSYLSNSFRCSLPLADAKRKQASKVNVVWRGLDPSYYISEETGVCSLKIIPLQPAQYQQWRRMWLNRTHTFLV